MPSEQAPARVRWDVGEQDVVNRAFVALAVAKEHMGELVEDELLTMQDRVAASVEDEVFGVHDQPQRADPVVVTELR
ncbi:hypothetical protein [Arthrobacter subterraneus]|uniref:hypothetical protein n=1 Tax=Arthrobacter subterraneus TaxID=335973 RepID=UPI0012EB30F4|nr:hypothetical protein [Arthrobacter subterraneus]